MFRMIVLTCLLWSPVSPLIRFDDFAARDAMSGLSRLHSSIFSTIILTSSDTISQTVLHVQITRSI